jgi:hypothetical protein
MKTKKWWIKGQKDQTLSHWNMSFNSKTNETFIYHNSEKIVIKVITGF